MDVFEQDELKQLSSMLGGQNVENLKAMIRMAVSQAMKGSSKANAASKRMQTATKNI
jgi:hypothetical protein